jgi:hypothetical protein
MKKLIKISRQKQSQLIRVPKNGAYKTNSSVYLLSPGNAAFLVLAVIINLTKRREGGIGEGGIRDGEEVL